MMFVKINCKEQSELDPSFYNGNRKMPIAIVSHGLKGHAHSQSGLCRELASQGFIVFSFDHSDETDAVNINEDK